MVLADRSRFVKPRENGERLIETSDDVSTRLSRLHTKKRSVKPSPKFPTLEGCFQCGREFHQGESFWYCPACEVSACVECAGWHEHQKVVRVTKVEPSRWGRVLMFLSRIAGRYFTIRIGRAGSFLSPMK